MLLGSLPMHCQAQRLLVKYAKNLGKTKVFTIIYFCWSSKSVQGYFTFCIILWKNNVFSRRRLGTLACGDFGALLAPFGRVLASKLAPCWGSLGLNWASNCDLKCLLGHLGALNWFWTSTRADYGAMAIRVPSWRPSRSILEVPSCDFEGFGRALGLFLDALLYILLLLKFKANST